MSTPSHMHEVLRSVLPSMQKGVLLIMEEYALPVWPYMKDGEERIGVPKRVAVQVGFDCRNMNTFVAKVTREIFKDILNSRLNYSRLLSMRFVNKYFFRVPRAFNEKKLSLRSSKKWILRH